MDALTTIGFIVFNPKVWYVVFDGLARVAFLILSIAGIISLIRGNNRRSEIARLDRRCDAIDQQFVMVEGSMAELDNDLMKMIEERQEMADDETDRLHARINNVADSVEHVTDRFNDRFDVIEARGNPKDRVEAAPEPF